MKYLLLYDRNKLSEIDRLCKKNNDIRIIHTSFFWKYRFLRRIDKVDAVIVFESSIKSSPNVKWEIEKLREHDMLFVLKDANYENYIINTKANTVEVPSKDSEDEIRRMALENGLDSMFNSRNNKELLKEFMFKMLETSESLINRRQTTNNYMLSANAILITLIGVLLGIERIRSQIYPILALPIIGIIICISWYSLLNSFGKLNKAKFEVICLLENRIGIPIFGAEWKYLSRKSIRYKSFTKTESVLPILFCLIYIAIFLLLIAISKFHFENGSIKSIILLIRSSCLTIASTG